MIDFYERLCDAFPIVSIEDPLAEDEWEAWTALTERLGDRVQLIGDDLFVTNVDRLRTRYRARGRERHPRQGQPDRHADRDPRRDRARPAPRAMRRSSRTVPGRPRTRPSPTWRLRQARGRSRRERRRVPTALRSTTSFCGSRSRSGCARPSPGALRFPGAAPERRLRSGRVSFPAPDEDRRHDRPGIVVAGGARPARRRRHRRREAELLPRNAGRARRRARGSFAKPSAVPVARSR